MSSEYGYRKGDPVPGWILEVDGAKAHFGCDVVVTVSRGEVSVTGVGPLAVITEFDEARGFRATGAPTSWYVVAPAVEE